MIYDVAIVEDVWGTAFEQLSIRRTVRREPEAYTDGELVRRFASQARALVVRNRTQVTRELMAASPHLEVVARAGVGLDNIDVPAADELGVVVVAGLGANAISVAEHALALALAVARQVPVLDASVRAGRWERLPGFELTGRTWGLLSAGATARATGRLAAALGMRVLAYDPYLAPDHPDLIAAGIILSSLETVVSAADVLSVHLPATNETRGLIDAALIARMKPGAILVNVGRGEVLDEDALVAALESGHLAGAGLDVRSNEPPMVGRLEQQLNVVLTPHVAGITRESQARITEILAHDIEEVLSGGSACNAVTTRRSPLRREQDGPRLAPPSAD
jgi:D-3-phosphoglycerate dehydrogenase